MNAETPLTDELMRDFGATRQEVPGLVTEFSKLMRAIPGGAQEKTGVRCLGSGIQPNDIWRHALKIVRYGSLRA